MLTTEQRGQGVKFIHTSDWHLGRRLFETDLHEHHERFLDWLLATAQDHDVAAVVVSGDIYDRAVPPPESVALLDRTFTAFARAGIPLVITSGNHDSAVRLGFGADLSALAGVHLFTSLDALTQPIELVDDHGPVLFYGVPYLLPDTVMRELDAERSHTSVLTSAMDRVRADAASRGISRIVVGAHAFITGATGSESERRIDVGGIGDAPASVFSGATYVALGHLHGAQAIKGPEGTEVRYSGSPLPFSFSERDHTKVVHLVDLSTDAVSVESLPTPQPRGMRELRGLIDELIDQGAEAPESARNDWVKVVLTDSKQPHRAMDRLRIVYPHILTIQFDPEGGLIPEAADLANLRRLTNPVDVCGAFVQYVANHEPSDQQREILTAATESAQHLANAEAGVA